MPPAEKAPASARSLSFASGARTIELPTFDDMRGSLSVGEIERDLPFIPRRVFVVYDVPSQKVRGEHAHKTLHEILICVSGSCRVVVDDGMQREEVILDRPSVGLYVPALTHSSLPLLAAVKAAARSLALGQEAPLCVPAPPGTT